MGNWQDPCNFKETSQQAAKDANLLAGALAWLAGVSLECKLAYLVGFCGCLIIEFVTGYLVSKFEGLSYHAWATGKTLAMAKRIVTSQAAEAADLLASPHSLISLSSA